MSLISFISDPMGKRYRKRTWGQALGITAAKRRINKTVFGPFRALSPSRHWRNFKERVKRKVGLRSEFAKAARTGQWGRYAKRKMFGESEVSASMIFYPFKRMNLRENSTHNDLIAHYNRHDHDSNQRGPQSSGMFRKLAKATALGVVVGLGAHKARSLAKVYHSPFHGHPSSYWHTLKGHAKHHADKAFAVFGKQVDKTAKGGIKSTGKSWRKRIKSWFKDSADGMVMPLQENFHNYPHHREHRQPTFLGKVMTAGVGLGAAALAVKSGHAILNPKLIAKRAAYHSMHAKRLKNLSKSSGKFGVGYRAGSMKHQVAKGYYDVLSTVAGVVHGHKQVKKMDKAYKLTKAKMLMGGKGMKKPVFDFGNANAKEVMKIVRGGNMGSMSDALKSKDAKREWETKFASELGDLRRAKTSKKAAKAEEKATKPKRPKAPRRKKKAEEPPKEK